MQDDKNSNDLINIPYVVYESAQSRMERNNKRLTIALVIAIILIFLSNALWLYSWIQYDYASEETSTTETYQQDGNGYNNINTGSQGDVTNGTEVFENDQDEEADEEEE